MLNGSVVAAADPADPSSSLAPMLSMLVMMIVAVLEAVAAHSRHLGLHRGWCVGKIIKKVTRGLSNFVAKFDIDSDVALLSLESKDYDISADGAYEAWMLLEPEGETAGVGDPGVTPATDNVVM